MFQSIHSTRTHPTHLFDALGTLAVALTLTALLFSSLLLAHTASAGQGSEATVASACATATVIAPHATLRLDTPEAVEILRLDLPSAGIVELDLSSNDPLHAPARLDLWQGCDSAGRHATVLARSPSHLVLAVHGKGTWWLRLGTAHDGTPRDGEALGRQKLTSRFVAAEVIEDLLHPTLAEGPSALGETMVRTRFVAIDPRTASPVAKGDPEQTDPDPDNRTHPTGHYTHTDLLATIVSSRTALALPKGDPEQTDPDPDSRRLPMVEPDTERVIFDAGACPDTGREVSDDHGDTPRCATRLGLAQRIGGPDTAEARIHGELSNAWGDDRDVFAVHLERLARIEISTTGDGDTLAELLDTSGRRLAMDDDGGEGRGAHLATTLAPGRYVVRVSGSTTAEGPYVLQVRTRSW